jgi:hypothetical protein
MLNNAIGTTVLERVEIPFQAGQPKKQVVAYSEIINTMSPMYDGQMGQNDLTWLTPKNIRTYIFHPVFFECHFYIFTWYATSD